MTAAACLSPKTRKLASLLKIDCSPDVLTVFTSALDKTADQIGHWVDVSELIILCVVDFQNAPLILDKHSVSTKANMSELLDKYSEDLYAAAAQLYSVSLETDTLVRRMMFYLRRSEEQMEAVNKAIWLKWLFNGPTTNRYVLRMLSDVLLTINHDISELSPMIENCIKALQQTIADAGTMSGLVIIAHDSLDEQVRFESSYFWFARPEKLARLKRMQGYLPPRLSLPSKKILGRLQEAKSRLDRFHGEVRNIIRNIPEREELVRYADTNTLSAKFRDLIDRLGSSGAKVAYARAVEEAKNAGQNEEDVSTGFSTVTSTIAASIRSTRTSTTLARRP